MKDRKALETYVSLKGFEHGGDRKSSGQVFHLILSDEPKTQRELERIYGIKQDGSGYYGNQYDMVNRKFRLTNLTLLICLVFLLILFKIIKTIRVNTRVTGLG